MAQPPSVSWTYRPIPTREIQASIFDASALQSALEDVMTWFRDMADAPELARKMLTVKVIKDLVQLYNVVQTLFLQRSGKTCPYERMQLTTDELDAYKDAQAAFVHVWRENIRDCVEDHLRWIFDEENMSKYTIDDETIFTGIAVLLKALMGDFHDVNENVNKQLWYQTLNLRSYSNSSYLNNDLQHNYRRFQRLTYFRDGSDQQQLWLVIWRVLSDIVLTLTKHKSSNTTHLVYPLEVLFLQAPGIKNRFEAVRQLSECFSPYEIEQLVGQYCAFIDTQSPNPTQPGTQAQWQLLLSCMDAGVRKVDATPTVIAQALHCAVKKLNLINGGIYSLRRETVTTGSWRLSPVRLLFPEVREAAFQREITNVPSAPQEQTAHQDTFEWKQPGSLEFISDFDYPYYPFPENQAQAVAASRDMSRACAGDKDDSAGVRAEDVVNKTAPWCTLDNNKRSLDILGSLLTPTTRDRHELRLVMQRWSSKRPAKTVTPLQKPQVTARSSSKHRKHALHRKQDTTSKASKDERSAIDPVSASTIPPITPEMPGLPYSTPRPSRPAPSSPRRDENGRTTNDPTPSPPRRPERNRLPFGVPQQRPPPRRVPACHPCGQLPGQYHHRCEHTVRGGTSIQCHPCPTFPQEWHHVCDHPQRGEPRCPRVLTRAGAPYVAVDRDALDPPGVRTRRSDRPRGQGQGNAGTGSRASGSSGQIRGHDHASNQILEGIVIHTEAGTGNDTQAGSGPRSPNPSRVLQSIEVDIGTGADDNVDGTTDGDTSGRTTTDLSDDIQAGPTTPTPQATSTGGHHETVIEMGGLLYRLSPRSQAMDQEIDRIYAHEHGDVRAILHDYVRRRHFNGSEDGTIEVIAARTGDRTRAQAIVAMIARRLGVFERRNLPLIQPAISIQQGSRPSEPADVESAEDVRQVSDIPMQVSDSTSTSAQSTEEAAARARRSASRSPTTPDAARTAQVSQNSSPADNTINNPAPPAVTIEPAPLVNARRSARERVPSRAAREAADSEQAEAERRALTRVSRKRKATAESNADQNKAGSDQAKSSRKRTRARKPSQASKSYQPAKNRQESDDEELEEGEIEKNPEPRRKRDRKTSPNADPKFKPRHDPNDSDSANEDGPTAVRTAGTSVTSMRPRMTTRSGKRSAQSTRGRARGTAARRGKAVKQR